MKLLNGNKMITVIFYKYHPLLDSRFNCPISRSSTEPLCIDDNTKDFDGQVFLVYI